MGFRTVIIKDRSKLDLKLNYLVCRNQTESKVFIPEISTLIIESTAVSLTSALLSELTKNNVKIVFCDEKHNPESELVSYYGNYNVSERTYNQIMWQPNICTEVWTKIVANKIFRQMCFLKKRGLKEADLLNSYIDQIEPNDTTNREGHAAKVYFDALFGNEFCRRDSSFVNSALNYGYAIILSCFNREIVAEGYLTQLGIWHKNQFNYFNLSCDLMEPFRIIVDQCVLDMPDKDPEFKTKLVDLLNTCVYIDGKKQYLDKAVTIYCQSVFEALNKNDAGLIKFYEL